MSAERSAGAEQAASGGGAARPGDEAVDAAAADVVVRPMGDTDVPAVVRPMGAADVPAVVRIERDAFDDPWSAATWSEELARDDRAWWVGTVRGEVVAVGGLWLAPDAAHVLRLAVAVEHRGRGLAGRLLDRLCDPAVTGDRPMTLEVRASNTAALSLYRQRGFVSHGVRPRYYADGEDAEVLWRGRVGDG